MTVSTTDSVVEYVSGGPTYPIPYRFLQNSDIQAVLVKQDGTSETLTGAQYTLSGAGTQSGGTLTSAYAAGVLATPGASLTISRVMNPVQPTDLRNQGRFLAETHESVFDRLTMLIQQGFAGISRALKRPVGKSTFYAENRNITDLADPVNAQDATTKNWVTVFFGSLIDAATGVINTTTGILYGAGTLFDYLKYGVTSTADSLDALRNLSSARNQRARTLGFYQKGDGGEGVYYVDPTDTTSTEALPLVVVGNDGARWKLVHNGWIRPEQAGAVGDGVTDDSFALQSSINCCGPNLGLWMPKAYRHSIGLIANQNYMRFKSAGRGSGLFFDPAPGQITGLHLIRTHLSPTDTRFYQIDDLSICLLSSSGVCRGLVMETLLDATTVITGANDTLIMSNVQICQRGDIAYWRIGYEQIDTGGVHWKGLTINNRLPAAQTDTGTAGIQIRRTDTKLSMIRTCNGLDNYIQRAYNQVNVLSASPTGIESIYLDGGEYVGTAGAVLKVQPGTQVQAMYMANFHADFSGSFFDGTSAIVKIFRVHNPDARKQNNGSPVTDVPVFIFDAGAEFVSISGGNIVGGGTSLTSGCYRFLGSMSKFNHTGINYGAFSAVFEAAPPSSLLIPIGAAGNTYATNVTVVYNWSSLSRQVKDSDADRANSVVVSMGASPFIVTLPVGGTRFFTSAPNFAGLVPSSSNGNTVTNIWYDYASSNDLSVSFVVTGTYLAGSNIRFCWNAKG